MAASEQCKAKLFIHEDLNFFQHLHENTFTGVSFLINIIAACNLSLSLFKKRFRQWCFPDSYLKFSATFLKREKKHCYQKKSIVMRKKHCYKKRGSDIYCKSNYTTFHVTLPRFLYFSTVHSDNRYSFISR